MKSDLNICLLVASHRANSQSLRIADYINQYFLAGKASLIDLYDSPLPLWDGTALIPGSTGEQRITDVKNRADAADAFVFLVPEWHGMVPAGLKNFLLWCGANELETGIAGWLIGVLRWCFCDCRITPQRLQKLAAVIFAGASVAA